MQNRQKLLRDLNSLLARKQSREYYAKILGVTTAELNDLMNELRSPAKTTSNYSVEVQKNENTKRFNIEKGEIEVNGYWNHEPSPEEIMASHNIDTENWKLTQYWSKQRPKGFQVSAMFSEKRKNKADIKEDFQTFLENYKPSASAVQVRKAADAASPNGCLIINKQDAHLNKFDRKGNNDIKARFSDFEGKVDRVLRKATSTTNLDKVIYVIGSDLFNSEWTNMTTHGTPQQNLMDHNSGFEAICHHEINVITNMSKYSDNVHVMYIVGNHDTYISWHLATWLKAYFRNVEGITFDTSDTYTKYIKYSNSAFAFNHGYKVKPETLAGAFPIEFKDAWSTCDNFTIFVGDLHTELSKQIGGIQFYRLAQVSNAVSNWDESMSYTLSKGTVTAFLIEEKTGYTDIYKA